MAGKTDSIASGCSRHYWLGTMAVRVLCLATPFHLSMRTGPATNDPDTAGRGGSQKSFLDAGNKAVGRCASRCHKNNAPRHRSSASEVMKRS